MTTAERLLDRLTHVRQTAPNRWISRCPGHEDKGPSLSIRELEDGRVLVHDFAGCGASDVLAAVGLELKDLYPNDPLYHRGRPTRSSIPPRDVLAVIGREVAIVYLTASDLVEGRTISEEQWSRLQTAVGRISWALEKARI